MSDHLGFGKDAKNNDEKVENLIKGIVRIKEEIGIPATIKEWGVSEKDFLEAVDEMALNAFDDQRTSANPRYPLISELKEIYLKAYYGEEYRGLISERIKKIEFIFYCDDKEKNPNFDITNPASKNLNQLNDLFFYRLILILIDK